MFASLSLFAAEPRWDETSIDNLGGVLVGLSSMDSWKQLKLKSYAYTLARDCSCVGSKHLRVYVVDAEVVRVKDLLTDNWLEEPSELLPFETIPELFEREQRLIKQLPYYFEVKHHPYYGYPEMLSVDVNKNIADDEFRYELSDLAKITRK